MLGDWGTSRLRLYLDDAGTITHGSEGPGIGTLAAVGEAARGEMLGGLIAPWMRPGVTTPVFLCGMAGSPSGLFEVPYAGLPADVGSWTRAARATRVRDFDVTIAAGVSTAGAGSRPDVMRGEETQVFGALALDPALAEGTQQFLLPGTHSKWVETSDGLLTRFCTAMSGELYALLNEHSTLVQAGSEAGAPGDAGEREAGIAAGVERSRTPDGGLLAALFEARAARLLDGRPPSWAAGFLSGLLIGYEIASMAALFPLPERIRVIGEPELVSLYRFVFTLRGERTEALDAADCAIAGLRLLRDQRRETP